MDIARTELYNDLTTEYKGNNPKINETSVTNDVVCLGFMFGNDFFICVCIGLGHLMRKI